MTNFLPLFAVVGLVLMSGTWKPGIAFDVAGTPVELQSLVRDDRVRRVPLGRLSAEDVLAVAGELIAGAQPAQPLADWLYAVSEGNAYILSELVRYARRSGVISPRTTKVSRLAVWWSRRLWPWWK